MLIFLVQIITRRTRPFYKYMYNMYSALSVTMEGMFFFRYTAIHPLTKMFHVIGYIKHAFD